MAADGIWQAAYAGNLEGVKSFMSSGTSVNEPDVLQGSTALHWACFGGHLNVVRWLVKEGGAEVNLANKDGCTPIFYACELCHTGVVQWLVREAGAEVNVKDTIHMQTPLHRVCFKGQQGKEHYDEELLLWMVTEGKADVYAVDRFGNNVEDLCSPRGLTKAPPGTHIADVMQSARKGDDVARRYSKDLTKNGSETSMSVQLSPKMEEKAERRKSLTHSHARSTASSRDASTGATAHGAGGGRSAAARAAPGSSDSQGGYRAANGTTSQPSLERETSVSNMLARFGGGKTGGSVRHLRERRPSGDAAPSGTATSTSVEPSASASASASDASSQAPPPPARVRRPSGAAAAEAETKRLEAQMQGAEDALKRAEDLADGMVANGSTGQTSSDTNAVVEAIKLIGAQKSAGVLSEEEFQQKKMQILEMERVRKLAAEDSRGGGVRGAEGAGAGVLLSVGQNTPPPSPTTALKMSLAGGEDDDVPVQPEVKGVQEMVNMSLEDKEKKRASFRASELDEYTDPAAKARARARGPQTSGAQPRKVPMAGGGSKGGNASRRKGKGKSGDPSLGHIPREQSEVLPGCKCTVM